MKRLMTLALLLVGLVVAGCGSSDSSSSSATNAEKTTEGQESADGENAGGDTTAEGEPSGDVSVSYISPVLSQPNQRQIALGFEGAAKELGWSSSVLDSNLSADRQISDVELAVSQGNAGIASMTIDPEAAAGAYEGAQSKGVPVIGLLSSGAGLSSSIWWELALCEPGGPQGVSAEKMAEMKPGAKTIMVGSQVAQVTREYSTCFKKEAEKAGLDVLEEGVTEVGNAADAQKVFEPLLTKYPDVEVVWAFNDETALGVGVALEAAGKKIATVDDPEGVIVVGSNGDKVAIEAVEQGRMSWTWDPDNVATGVVAVKALKDAFDGKKTKYVVESQLIDSETVGDYVEPEQRQYTLANVPVKK